MKQLRRNVFETNSSSSHSISITNSTLVGNVMPVVNDWDICDGEDTLIVELTGFCSWYDHDTQNDKLAYLIMQIAYITHNSYATGWYGSEEQVQQAREDLYDSEEFKELEAEICDYVGCKHVRIKTDSEGYIDHESVCYDIEELKHWDIPFGGYVGLVFAASSYIHFEHNG